MADRALNLRDWEVRAFLDGRKTRFMRPLKEQRHVATARLLDGRWQWLSWKSGCVLGDVALPYAPGDRLWCREAFWLCDECGYLNYVLGANSAGWPGRKCCTSCDSLLPKAKRSSATMPRWASRLTLLVRSVRVHRLQDITEDEALAEGAKRLKHDGSPINHLGALYEESYGEGLWAASPWVVACTVERADAE